MRELLDTFDRWQAAGRRSMLARVVEVDGSGPRLPGAAMAVNEDGEVAGSVSGGCVEGAVVEHALGLLESGGREVVTFGYSDDDAFAVGLTCGGTIHLLIEPYEGFDAVAASLKAERPVAIATIVGGPDIGAKLLVDEDDVIAGTLGNDELDRIVARDAQGELSAGTTAVRHYGPCGEARSDDVSIFIESFAPAPKMLIFGAVDFTAALASAAKLLGYHVTVCDARQVFATKRRFPMADEVVVDWPHRLVERVGPELSSRDAICVLTHDHKFDVPAIAAAVRTGVGYLGAMGSRRTHDERLRRLRDEGVTGDELARVMGPIGLDIGARTPEETAVSVLAEIVAQRSGRSGVSLRSTSGPIHAATSS